MLDQGYGILPNTILFDKELSDKEKLLFVIISSLCAEKGYCRANNNYFAEKLGITKSRISNWITSLYKKGHIKIDIKKDEGNKRYISIAVISNTYCGKQHEGIAENSNTPIAENSTHNNINNNSINNKSITKKSLHDEKIKDDILNQGNRFEEFWKIYPNPTSNGVTKKIVLEYYKRASDNEDNIIDEVNLINWYIRYGIIDPKYVKSCNNWIIGFKSTNQYIKEQNIKKIVYVLMQKKDPEVAKQLMQDFGKDVIDKFVKQYNNEHNTPILK